MARTSLFVDTLTIDVIFIDLQERRFKTLGTLHGRLNLFTEQVYLIPLLCFVSFHCSQQSFDFSLNGMKSIFHLLVEFLLINA